MIVCSFVVVVFLFSPIAAIQALKRKKRFEKQLKQIDGTLSMIELQREALEGAKTNTATITTMKQASDAMKAIQKDLYVLNGGKMRESRVRNSKLFIISDYF